MPHSLNSAPLAPAVAADTASPAGPSLHLESFLPYRLNLLATDVSQTLARAYGERFEISIPEWRILATLGQFGMITAREIGLHSKMHKTTVSRAVAALEKRRLVMRRANKADMREAFLTMSEEGQAMYFKIVPMARSFADSLCLGLSQEERAVLEVLLSRLSERVAHLANGHGIAHT